MYTELERDINLDRRINELLILLGKTTDANLKALIAQQISELMLNN